MQIYCYAGDLDIYRPRLNAKNRLRSYIQVMEGLSFIHSRDMIHCDIKPENILVTTNGNFVISDFGEAVMLKVGTIFGWRSHLYCEANIT